MEPEQLRTKEITMKTYHVMLTSKGFTGESPSEKAIEDKAWAAILANPKKYITLSTLEIHEPLGIYPGDEELINIVDLHTIKGGNNE